MSNNKIRSSKALLLILLVSMVALTGCPEGQTNDVNYHTGRDGLTLKLLSEEQTDLVYENSTFPLSYVVENKGAHDLGEDDDASFTLSWDPFYVEVKETQAQNVKYSKGSLTYSGIQLYGKSKYYPTGTSLALYFPEFKTKPILGQREMPQTKIFATLCYPYETVLSELVCVDFDIYKENARSQVCRQQDLGFSDQGAPVAVTLLEVENQPAGDDLVRPVYTVHVSNVGGGTIIKPGQSSEETRSLCSSSSEEEKVFNVVEIKATLSGNVELQCQPSEVRLSRDEGITRCAVTDEDLRKTLSWRQNYLSPLTINLRYIYRVTQSKTIDIKRLNLYGSFIDGEQEECLPFEVKDSGNCVSRCEYCVTHPSSSECNVQSNYPVEFSNGFECACSFDACSKLYPKGLCLPVANFCPVPSYCCIQECKSGQIRNPQDGACYPKCVSGCAQQKVDCACGAGDDAKFILKGAYCCAKNSESYAEEQGCTEACA